MGGVNLRRKDPYLARTLLDLSQTATIADSTKVAKAVLGELGRVGTLHKNQVEQAGERVKQIETAPAGMTDIELPPHISIDRGRVVKRVILPGKRVARRRLQAAFSHSLPSPRPLP